MQRGLVLPFKVILLPTWWYTRCSPEIPWKGGTWFCSVTASISNSTTGKFFLARTRCCWEKGRRLWGEVYCDRTARTSPLNYYRRSEISFFFFKLNVNQNGQVATPRWECLCGTRHCHPWHLLLTLCWVSESRCLMLLFVMDDNPTPAVARHQRLGLQNASSTSRSTCTTRVIIIIAWGLLLLKKRLAGKKLLTSSCLSHTLFIVFLPFTLIRSWFIASQ